MQRRDDKKETDAPVVRNWKLPSSEIDPDALKIVRRLRRHGHEIYLVGGCVRDLLMGRRPKDFDLATSATPEQIKKLFRNCRIIGRRFRLAHIFFGPKIIETATFRANPRPSMEDDEVEEAPEEEVMPEGEEAEPEGEDDEPEGEDDVLKGREEEEEGGEGEGEEGFSWQEFDEAEVLGPNDELLIRRDNVFGTAEQDARRRDFAINALFYEPLRGQVIDFVDGLSDLKQRRLRTIGDPEIRFREDPVRILRAAKFAARLDLEIEPDTFDAMVKYKEQLRYCAPARVLEEITRLLREGTSKKALELMAAVSALETLLPDVARCLEDRLKAGRLRNRLRAVDELAADLGARMGVGAGMGSGAWMGAGRDTGDGARGGRDAPKGITANIGAGAGASGSGGGSALTRPVVLANLLVETLDPKWSEDADVSRYLDEHLRPKLVALNASRKESERIKQILMAQRRFLPGGTRRRTQILLRQEFFPEALTLYEIGCRALLLPDMDNLKKWKELTWHKPKPAKKTQKHPRSRISRQRGQKQ